MTYRQCSKCLMDTTDPDITFDSRGVCNHCRQYDADEEQRQSEIKKLPIILSKLKKDGCLLGLSGGVDSAMCLHYLVQNGIKPLCFSLDNKWNTPQSEENIKNLVKKTGVNFFDYKIDNSRFLGLQVAFLMGGIKNVEAVTDHLLFAATYELAAMYGIKYVVSGGNLATENTMPAAWGEDPRDLHWIKSVYKKVMGEKLTGLPMISLFKEQYYRLIKRIKFVRLLDYYDYNRAEAIELLKREYDFKEYGEKHCENVFTWWFQNYYLFEKWGIDKRKAHLSSLIHSGQITREEAMIDLGKNPVYPQIGLERKVMSYPKKSYNDYHNSRLIRKLVILLYKYAKNLAM